LKIAAVESLTTVPEKDVEVSVKPPAGRVAPPGPTTGDGLEETTFRNETVAYTAELEHGFAVAVVVVVGGIVVVVVVGTVAMDVVVVVAFAELCEPTAVVHPVANVNNAHMTAGIPHRLACVILRS
jgi:hypothetical protein